LGQSSTFLPNRQGSFQYWSECWDSKKTFDKVSVEHFFIKKTLDIFIKNKSFLNWCLIKKIVTEVNLKKTELLLKSDLSFEQQLLLKKKNNKKKIFSGHADIFRYQSWLFLKFFFFNTVFLKKKKQKKKFLKKKKLYAHATKDNRLSNYKLLTEK